MCAVSAWQRDGLHVTTASLTVLHRRVCVQGRVDVSTPGDAVNGNHLRRRCCGLQRRDAAARIQD